MTTTRLMALFYWPRMRMNDQNETKLPERTLCEKTEIFFSAFVGRCCCLSIDKDTDPDFLFELVSSSFQLKPIPIHHVKIV